MYIDHCQRISSLDEVATAALGTITRPQRFTSFISDSSTQHSLSACSSLVSPLPSFVANTNLVSTTSIALSATDSTSGGCSSGGSGLSSFQRQKSTVRQARSPTTRPGQENAFYLIMPSTRANPANHYPYEAPHPKHSLCSLFPTSSANSQPSLSPSGAFGSRYCRIRAHRGRVSINSDSTSNTDSSRSPRPIPSISPNLGFEFYHPYHHLSPQIQKPSQSETIPFAISHFNSLYPDISCYDQEGILAVCAGTAGSGSSKSSCVSDSVALDTYRGHRGYSTRNILRAGQCVIFISLFVARHV
ncbi:unnamed protein product [Protopolystoma xenopodis]|uniref:Uncharacterized protein n=1 Tax=Protopolystoma xenopodis TaxID=117903 RepID=A0A3S5AH89_9PLAT|nr:unnamed protein product [Protopolystoma xenopodis]